MNNYNGDKEEKGGFWSALSGLFRGGASSMGGASSGIGSAGGLFATKAGIMGMVLGGATIAAGVGVVYNFVGTSSKPVYSPELFQNSYYEEESNAASQERAQAKDRSSASASTLDMFSEQAKKDGMNGLASETSAEEKDEDASASAEAPADAPAAAASAVPALGGSGEGSSAGRLKASSGFGGSKGAGGGSSSSSMPRLKNAGGLSGGIGGQFSQMYRAPAGKDGGRVAGMSAMAARAKSSPKYAVPNFNKKGAHAQAKFAGTLGAKAAYSASDAGARTSASEAFVGETTGEGDIAAGGEGAGMGGAGIAGGAQLKGNDPSLNKNSSNGVPEVTKSENVSDWAKLEKGIFWTLIGGAVALLAGMGLAKLAKTASSAAAVGLYLAAEIAAAIAFAAGLAIIIMGIIMMTKYKQTWAGIMYIASGAYLCYKAARVFFDAKDARATAKEVVANSGEGEGADTVKEELAPEEGGEADTCEEDDCVDDEAGSGDTGSGDTGSSAESVTKAPTTPAVETPDAFDKMTDTLGQNLYQNGVSNSMGNSGIGGTGTTGTTGTTGN